MTICVKCKKLLHYKNSRLFDTLDSSDENVSNLRKRYIEKLPKPMQKDDSLLFAWCGNCYPIIKVKR